MCTGLLGFRSAGDMCICYVGEMALVEAKGNDFDVR